MCGPPDLDRDYRSSHHSIRQRHKPLVAIVSELTAPEFIVSLKVRVQVQILDVLIAMTLR